MTTMIRAGARLLLLALALVAAVGCNGKSGTSSPDLGGPPADLAPPTCVTNPETGDEILNACTSAQTGDPAKDAPYHPSLAPNGNLPPLS